MALKDYLGIIDNGLKQLFDRKAADPAKSRRPLAARHRPEHWRSSRTDRPVRRPAGTG